MSEKVSKGEPTRVVAEPAVELVQEGERLTYVSGASKFYYRRLTSQARNRLIQKCTKRGATDWGRFIDLAMEWALLGWDNVRAGGKVVEFDPELVNALPGDLVLELQELMGAKAAEEEKRLGN